MSVAISLTALFLAAPELGVVVGKRSGVSAPVAAARAQIVRSALGTPFAEGPVDDFTACASKRPCLVKEARARQWKALVVVETATIISDALVKVTVLSIDDDGREVATTSVQAAEEKLAEALTSASDKVRAELAALLPRNEPLAVRTAEVKPEPRTQPPAELVRPTKPAVVATSDRPIARWLPAAGGVVLVGIGVAFVVGSSDVATRLRTQVFDDASTVADLAKQGASLQTAGAVLITSGAVATLGGVLLALLWPEAPVMPTALPTPAGLTVGVMGVLQ